MITPKHRIIIAALIWLSRGPWIRTASADDVQVNAYTTGDQRFPSVAVDATGNAVVVWASDGSSGSDTSDASVQGQLYAADGSPLAGEFQVNTYTTGDQRFPSVARMATGEFIVVWRSDGSSGTDASGSSVQGQRYAADGSPVGSEFQVNDFTTGGQGGSSVAVDADGDFAVVWLSSGSGGTDNSGTSVQGRRFVSSGLPAGGQFKVNTYTTFDQRTSKVAMADAGEFVVVWGARDFDNGGYIYYSIHAQRYASDGSPAGPNFGINSYNTSTQVNPSVAMDSAGNFVVVWGAYYISGQRFDADGSPMGDQFEIDSDYFLHRFPSVAMNAGGDFVVAWQDNDHYGTDTSSWHVNAKRYDSFGSLIAGPFQVNTYTTSWQQHPVVAIDDAGDFVIAWESNGSSGTDADSYSIQRTPAALIFADGFESGDTGAWQ